MCQDLVPLWLQIVYFPSLGVRRVIVMEQQHFATSGWKALPHRLTVDFWSADVNLQETFNCLAIFKWENGDVINFSWTLETISSDVVILMVRHLQGSGNSIETHCTTLWTVEKTGETPGNALLKRSKDCCLEWPHLKSYKIAARKSAPPFWSDVNKNFESGPARFEFWRENTY